MSYDKSHQEGDCDKCLRKVGKANLKPVDFLYLDKNDRIHPDMSPILRAQGRQCIDGYRAYYVCSSCYLRMTKTRR